uniref:Uncharacterized protein n=1 Tax=Arundo donax TaxID=35708 RepID=A0A0A8ZLJ6_ARUDO
MGFVLQKFAFARVGFNCGTKRVVALSLSIV